MRLRETQHYLFKAPFCDVHYLLDVGEMRLRRLYVVARGSATRGVAVDSENWVASLLEEYFTTAAFPDRLPWKLFDFSWCNAEMLRFYMNVVQIPPGSTVTYGEIARKVFGSSRYARKAALYLARNRIGLFIPCHRVWRRESPGGYTPGGPEIKFLLVQWEKIKRRN